MSNTRCGLAGIGRGEFGGGLGFLGVFVRGLILLGFSPSLCGVVALFSPSHCGGTKGVGSFPSLRADFSMRGDTSVAKFL